MIAVYQSKNLSEHVKIANLLLDKGLAYKCYCSVEDLKKKKKKLKKDNTNIVENAETLRTT